MFCEGLDIHFASAAKGNSLTELESRLEFALQAAEKACDFILGYYQAADLEVERKRDRTPVTQADRGAEELLRREITVAYPRDAILGEEFGDTSGESGYRWILDPVDGTKSFIHGVPLFGTMIGLEHSGECVMGVIAFPALGETVWGGRGLGAWWKKGNGAPRVAKVSNVTQMSEALLCLTTIEGWAKINGQDKLQTLLSKVELARGWGDCYGHMLVATGRADVMVDVGMNPWDVAAVWPIMEAAGGVFCDWQGQTTIHGGNGISVVPALREEVLGILQG